MKTGVNTLKNSGAGCSTIRVLGFALLVAIFLILPSLIYLIYSFQKKRFIHDTDFENMLAEDQGKTE